MVICSNHEEEKSHIISKLHLYRRHYAISYQSSKYRQYLKQHFVAEEEPDRQTRASQLPVVASEVDCERCVGSLAYHLKLL